MSRSVEVNVVGLFSFEDSVGQPRGVLLSSRVAGRVQKLEGNQHWRQNWRVLGKSQLYHAKYWCVLFQGVYVCRGRLKSFILITSRLPTFSPKVPKY